MMLEGAEGRIWCSKIGWQTVPCSWSIDGKAVLSPGNQAGCHVLHRLESLKINISDPGQKRDAVVQSTTNYCGEVIVL